MKFFVKDPLFFKIFRELKSASLDPIFLKAYPEYLEIRQMNIAHTCLIHIKINANLFEEYIADAEEIISIPADLFFNTLKTFAKGENTLFETGEHRGGAVLTISAPTERGAKKTHLKLYSSEEWEEVPQVNVEHLSVLKIDSGDFFNSVKDANSFNTEAVLESTDASFVISANGDLGEYSEIWRLGDNMVSLFQEECKSLFNMFDLIMVATVGKSISDGVQISLGDMVPAKFLYSSPNVMGTFYIAPMIM